MRTLEKGVAFNPSYRLKWQDYLASRSPDEIKRLTDTLTVDMDSESQDLCKAQVDLVPKLYPHPMLSQLQFEDSLKQNLLPKATRGHLRHAGYFDDQNALLSELQDELGLPESPLPELILDSGLKYIAPIAKKRIPGTAVIDGGAYIGDTASLFARRYAPRAVYAFEPEPGNFEKMESLVPEWGMQEKIHPRQMALGAAPGEMRLWGTSVGTSSLGKHNVQDDGFTVSMTSVDAFVKDENVGDVGLIKLDVEGAEFAAVEGCVETIRRDRPILVISAYHAPADFFEIKPLIEKLGAGYRFMFRKITDDFIKELVLIAVREEDV